MDSAIHLLSNWPQVVRVKNLLPWFPVPLAGSRGMRTTLRCRRRQGRGREGKGCMRGLGEKSPRQEHWEGLHENEEQLDKKTRTKQRVSNIFPIFSSQNKTFSSQPRWKVCFRMEILGKCIFSRQDKALSSLDILQFVWISLLFFLPWVFRKFTNEGLHKTPRFLLADFSLSVLSCRCCLP